MAKFRLKLILKGASSQSAVTGEMSLAEGNSTIVVCNEGDVEAGKDAKENSTPGSGEVYPGKMTRATALETLATSVSKIEETFRASEGAIKDMSTAARSQAALYAEDIASKKKSRDSDETDRIMKRIILLHEQLIIDTEEFQRRLKEASGIV